jgi:hypothetical protein
LFLDNKIHNVKSLTFFVKQKKGLKLYKKKGVGLNFRNNLGGKHHTWKIGNLKTKKREVKTVVK